MPRKKTHRHKRRNVVSARGGPGDFRVREKIFFFIAVFIVAAVFFLNPKPADVSFNNIYQKMTHIFLHERSEYLSDAYVDDIQNQNGEYNSSAEKLAAIFDNNPVKNVVDSPAFYEIANVLPANIEEHVLAAADDSKWIEVDLSEQKIRAWENGEEKMEFLVSTGKPWTPTPTGEWRIWIKLRYATMKGGSKERGDYYYLPNVPYVMYFYKGYGIHGAYWHMNFGQPMSHGCINVKPEEAGQLFAWATPTMDGKSTIKSSDENPGTRVVVHD